MNTTIPNDLPTASDAGGSLYRRLSKPKPITEAEIVRALPSSINAGGTLEMKRGKLCLRCGDEVELLQGDKYRITREWLPPGMAPWDRDLYAIANAAG